MEEINFEIGSVVEHKLTKEKVLILDKVITQAYINYLIRLPNYNQVEVREFELEEIK